MAKDKKLVEAITSIFALKVYNQRCSVVRWEKTTGKPAAKMVYWGEAY